MIIDVVVPMLPESVTEATLMTWNKKVGDFVQRDENLIDLETDKVVLQHLLLRLQLLVVVMHRLVWLCQLLRNWLLKKG